MYRLFHLYLATTKDSELILEDIIIERNQITRIS